MPVKKSPVKLHVTTGGLFGYSLKLLLRERRELLLKAIKQKKLTPATAIKRLNVLYIFNKNKHPESAAKFQRDLKYIQRTFN